MEFKLAKPLSIYELGQRKNQEDAIFPALGKATESDRLFILCDGMGGHEAGEVASNTVCRVMGDTVLSQYRPGEVFTEDAFQTALEAAYAALDEKDEEATAKKMGTTMTFLMLHAGGCMMAHIGDSRIYHIRPSEKKILYVSRDHSLVRDLYELGEITWEEMKTSKQRNIITRAMQPHQEKRARADIHNTDDILPGDYFFMCSDGMLEEMEDENLVNILSDGKTSDEEKVRILTEVSRDSRDNHSAHLIHVLEVSGKREKQAAKATSEAVCAAADGSVAEASVAVNDSVAAGAAPLVHDRPQPVAADPEQPDDSLRKGSKWGKVLKVAVFLVVLFALIYFVTLYFLNGGKVA